MTINQAIEALVDRRASQANFYPGDPWSSADIPKLEHALNRRIAKSWSSLLTAFGASTFRVRSPRYENPAAPKCPGELAYRLPDPQGWNEVTLFEVGFSTINSFLRDDPWGGYRRTIGRDGLVDEGQGHWLIIAWSGDGDALIVPTQPLDAALLDDSEAAWFNHETAVPTYRWPGLAAFVQHMLELDAQTPESMKSKQP